MLPTHQQLRQVNALDRACGEYLDRIDRLARQSRRALLSSRMSLALAAERVGRARALIARSQGRRGSAWPAPAEPAS